MPPKPPKPPSKSKELIRVGPKHVAASHKKKGGVRDEDGQKPTTKRALELVLRNGKHGARGTGELVLANKLTGKEKLDVLAEEEVRKALTTPFDMEQCLKIAESEYDLSLDEIALLRDNSHFAYVIKEEALARAPAHPEAKAIMTDKVKKHRMPELLKEREKQLKNASYVASIITTKVHNSYMLASAWQLVYATLKELQKDGLSKENLRAQLTASETMRSRYLALYHLINEMVATVENTFSVLAMRSDYWSSCFKKSKKKDTGEEDMEFDTVRLPESTRSFIDAIVIEICFPRSPYPNYILLKLLNEALDEQPRDGKHFPQKLWDVTGELSILLALKEKIEAPFLGPDGEKLKEMSFEMPEGFGQWKDAQYYSLKASNDIGFKDMVHPLDKTEKATVLENMWKTVNLSYLATSGVSIDALWGLEGALDRTPQWNSYYFSSLNEDDDKRRPRTIAGKKEPLAITDKSNKDTESDYASMPDLQSVSNSSDEDDEYEDDSDFEDDSGDSGDESGYDTGQEEELRVLLKEAYETAVEADFQEEVGASADPFTEDVKKGNPFLKLLGSLRGRLFSSDPKMRSADPKAAPRTQKGSFNRPKAPDRTRPRTAPMPTKSKKTPGKAAPTSTRTGGVTLEEVDDVDDETAAAKKKKKKKKPKKKKKKAATTTAEAEESDADDDAGDRPATPPPKSPTVSPQASPQVPAPAKKQPPKSPAKPKANPAAASTTSFALPNLEPTTTGQSGHSFMKEMEPSKNKVKTRADHASIFSEKEQKKGFLSKFGFGSKGKPVDEVQEKAKASWFNRLNKKTTELAQQLLKTPTDQKGRRQMKWADFEKFMKKMGFEMDPTTAGSSVRFDPPNKNDRSITFHKPHPDTTLTHDLITVFGKKLKDYYGWDEKDLLNFQ